MISIAKANRQDLAWFAQRSASVAASFLFILASAVAANRPAPQPVFLGDAQVGQGLDHDTIRLRQNGGAFRAIEIRVDAGAVRFHRLIVSYQDGLRQELRAPRFVPAGGRSPQLRFPAAVIAGSGPLTCGTASCIPQPVPEWLYSGVART